MNLEYLEFLPFFLYLFNLIDKQFLAGYMFGIWLSTRRDFNPYVKFVETNLSIISQNVTTPEKTSFIKNYFN